MPIISSNAFNIKPCNTFHLYRNESGKNLNNKKAIVKQVTAMMMVANENCRYHCKIIPAMNGKSSLVNGAVFQTGMLWVRSIFQNKKQKGKFQILFTQMHTPLLIQLPEIGISQIFDETDRFTRALHLGAKLFINTGKFIE